MKVTEFKTFCEVVENASKDDTIFYDFFRWGDLTEKQVKRIIPIVGVKSFVQITCDLDNGVTRYRLPSGIELLEPGSTAGLKYFFKRQIIDC